MYKRVISIVISFHLLFLMFLLFSPIKKANHVPTHIKARIVHPTATVKKAPLPTAKPAAVQKAPSKTEAIKPQPAAKKPAAANKPAIIEKGKPIKKAAPKKTEPPEKMWNEIDQALAKIEKKSYPVSKQPLSLPKPIAFLEPEKNEAGDDSAVSHLMGFLHDTLHLPEVGEVKIEITVSKNGRVAKVVILRSESQKNKLYLQEHLPLLQLPLQFDQDKTWIITFCNEI